MPVFLYDVPGSTQNYGDKAMINGSEYILTPLFNWLRLDDYNYFVAELKKIKWHIIDPVKLYEVPCFERNVSYAEKNGREFTEKIKKVVEIPAFWAELNERHARHSEGTKTIL